MKRFFAQIDGEDCLISGDDFVHLSSVLRCKVGDELVCICGDEFDYISRIEKINKKDAVLKVLEKKKNLHNPTKNIVLFMGISKGEKMELIAQKITEIGLNGFVPFDSEFVVKKSVNFERVKKISLEALKQCKRSVPLVVSDVISFNEMLKKVATFDFVVFANEKEKSANLENFENAKNVAIIVGGEGGFSDSEVEQITNLKNARSISLGSRILRAETAAIALSFYVSYSLKN